MITLFFILITLVYVMIIFYAIYGIKLSVSKFEEPTEYPFCSIIIAARNEADTIKKTLESLSNQNYPHHKFEVLICNDHSEDNTQKIIENYSQNDNRIRLYNLPDTFSGKKQALEYVLQFAQGELFLFTDADCNLPNEWIASYACEHVKKNGVFYFGIVSHTIEKNMLQKFFTLDFLGIVLVQSGFAKLGKAFSCNAANMAITKDFYKKSYDTKSEFSSGDDVFLLHTAKKTSPDKIVFIGNNEAIVETHVPKTLKSFIYQRIRWASKATGYTDTTAILVSFTIFTFNFTLVTIAVFSMFTSLYIEPLLWIFVSKTICDFILFYITLPQLKKQNLLWYVIPFEFLYSFYITIIPIFAILFPATWKGRKIK